MQFIISARKTSRLVEELKAADWKRSPRTDADGQCEFRYQPEGWGKAYRFIALRYEKKPKPSAADEPEQYQLFDTPEYSYRVFVTNMKDADRSAGVVLQSAGRSGEPDQRSQQRCGSGRASIGALDDELQPFPAGDAGLQPELLADAVQSRGRRQGGNAAAHHAGDGPACGFCFWRPRSGATPDESGSATAITTKSKGIFCRLLDRLRAIAPDGQRFGPVLATPLTG